MHQCARFQRFVDDFTRLIGASDADESRIREDGRVLLARLVEHDDWLPEAFTHSHPQYYQQYLLHCDPKERFTVVSFVWGPGQKTPVHDHMTWGLIGMLRGAERGERFELAGCGQPMRKIAEDVLDAGDTDWVSPTLGDIHRVENVHEDRISISIHVYGGNIGKIERHVYDPRTGAATRFISGYSNAPKPAA